MFGSASKKAVYGCTALVGSNKVGKLTPDEAGYYTVVVGALNAFNSGGAHYPMDPAKKLFDSSSSFMRRVENGNCKGEMGHPKPVAGQLTRDFLTRVMQIEETRVCCHFRRIWLQEEGIKDGQGRPIVAILAEVKPCGPMGNALKESLENPHENVNFSIRSLTQDNMSPAGYLQKNIKNIITFDVVTEPGMSGSNKYNSPALESFEEMTITRSQFEHFKHGVMEKKVVGFENALIDMEDVATSFGWDDTFNHSKPVSIDW